MSRPAATAGASAPAVERMLIKLPLNPERIAFLTPHRFRTVSSNLVVIEDDNVRIELHLSDAQLSQLRRAL